MGKPRHSEVVRFAKVTQVEDCSRGLLKAQQVTLSLDDRLAAWPRAGTLELTSALPRLGCVPYSPLGTRRENLGGDYPTPTCLKSSQEKPTGCLPPLPWR